MLKLFLAAKKHPKLVPKMVVVMEYKGLNIKYSHRDP